MLLVAEDSINYWRAEGTEILQYIVDCSLQTTHEINVCKLNAVFFFEKNISKLTTREFNNVLTDGVQMKPSLEKLLESLGWNMLVKKRCNKLRENNDLKQ